MTTMALSPPDLSAVVRALRHEVTVAGLPVDFDCGHTNSGCACHHGVPTKISDQVVLLNNESSASDDWRRPLVWLAGLRDSPDWDDLPAAAKDLIEGDLHWALALYLPRCRLSIGAKTAIAAAGGELLERRIAAARLRHDEVAEIMVRSLARLCTIAGRTDALDILKTTFGRPVHEWPRDHPDTVLEYHVRASSVRDYGGSNEEETLRYLEELKTELLGCVEHGRACATHGGPAWGPSFRQALADTQRHIAETLPLNNRISLALSARDHLFAALTTPGITFVARINCIIEWGGLHRMPQGRAGHRRLQRDEIELVRELNRTGQAGGTPMLIEALLRRGRDTDRDEARRLLASLDIENDFVHPYLFHSLFPNASRASLDDLADALVKAKPGTEIEWQDHAGRLYVAWGARHNVDIALKVSMARHCLKAHDLGAGLTMIARAATLGLQAYEESLALPPDTPALAETARHILTIFAVAHDTLDGVGPETLVEMTEWALRVTPPRSYYRPELEALAATVLSRAEVESDQHVELLRSGWDGFKRRGDVAQARNAAVEYAIARLNGLVGKPDFEQAAGAQALLDELDFDSIPREVDSYVRAQMVLAMCHYRVHRRGGAEAATLDAAVARQSAALREVERCRGRTRNEALASVMTLVFRVDKDRYPDDARLLTRVLTEATHAPIGIRNSLWALNALLNGVGTTCDLDEAVNGANRAFDLLYTTMEQLEDARVLLAKIQGWAYYLAELLLDAGDANRAATWLEMGSAVLLRQQVVQEWKGGGAQPVLWSRPAVYLVARKKAGYALIWDGGDVTRTVELPALNQDAAKGWREAFATDRTATSRAVRSVEIESVAQASVVNDTLEAIEAAVRPLLDELAESYPDLKDWIPCGDLSGLPWAAAVVKRGNGATVPCVQASLTARQIALERAKERLHSVGVAAVTNPTPCTLNGRELPELPGATREGLWLRDNVGAVVHDGPDADRVAFDEVTSRDLKVLHLAMHGVVEDGVLGGTRLFLRNTPTGRTSLVSTSNVANVQGCARLVWLGACWAGQPNSLLPDESHGLVTGVVHRLGSTVVAPLWPVDDTIAAEFAEDFYQSWLIEGVPIEEAFRRAMLYARSLDEDGSWAAFTLVGAGSSQDEREAFSRR